MVARVDVWLKLQRDLVDNGTAAATVVLEGPDQSRSATWPIGFPHLEDSISGLLASLGESFAPGRHQCRLVALDVNGQQLSALPLVVVGTCDAAREAAQGRVGNERANALFISNAEKMIEVQQSVIERASSMMADLHSAIGERDRQLDQILAATKDQQVALLNAAARNERLSKLGEQFAPLLEVGVAFVAQFASEWLAKKEVTSGPKTASAEPACAGNVVGTAQPALVASPSPACGPGNSVSATDANGGTSEPTSDAVGGTSGSGGTIEVVSSPADVPRERLVVRKRKGKNK